MKVEFDWDKSFDKFLNSLNALEKAKILALIQSIEEQGLEHAIKIQWVKRLEKNLYEIRTRTDDTFLRGIYFQVDANNYFITHGFKKKTNQTPEKEKNKAKLIRKRKLGR